MILTTVSGGVRFGVRCFDDAKGCLNADAWNLRATIPISKSGHHDFGPNVYGILVGARFGLKGSLLTNAAIIAATSSLAALKLKSEYGAMAATIYSALLAYGPTGICNAGLPNFTGQ